MHLKHAVSKLFVLLYDWDRMIALGLTVQSGDSVSCSAQCQILTGSCAGPAPTAILTRLGGMAPQNLFDDHRNDQSRASRA